MSEADDRAQGVYFWHGMLVAFLQNTMNGDGMMCIEAVCSLTKDQRKALIEVARDDDPE